ncbi:LPXTG cell wall anchor domain-containing protein [Brevibacterium sp. GP-SGM9]|uniref:LPXTG cell wall anchor domain-containing protein n=1 Tax=Brevibacterium sp. GP-SGM9 TaxID=3376990 RepID=UPI0039A50B02
MTGLAGAPAFAATESAPAPAGPLCAYDNAQQSDDSESDSKVPDESDPQATLAKAQVTRDDIADRKKGIGFSGTGFSPDEKATVTVVGTDGTKYSPETKLTVDEKGKVSGTYFFSASEGAKVPVGEYSLYLSDLKSEKDSSKVTFEVVADESDLDDSGKGSDCNPAKPPKETDEPSETPSESPSKSEEPSETPSESPSKTEEPSKTPSESPSETKEPSKSASPTPSETKEPSKTPSESPSKTDEPKETEEPKKTEDPKESDPKESETDEPAAKPSPSETDDSDASDSDAKDPSASSSPGSEDEDKKAAPAATQALVIEPTEISSENFLDKGIKLGVTGAKPGEKITITVEHAQGKVDRYTMTKEADDEGKATFGVQAKVKAVLGTYNVRAQAESFDEPQGGSFTVVTNGTDVDESGNGGNGSGSGSDNNGSGSGSSSDLPRTGAEMTGMALGVGLLVVGAAAVIITRRRMTASDDPAEF